MFFGGALQGNKRTPERFVGREAVITTQCLNGWYGLFSCLVYLSSSHSSTWILIKFQGLCLINIVVPISPGT